MRSTWVEVWTRYWRGDGARGVKTGTQNKHNKLNNYPHHFSRKVIQSTILKPTRCEKHWISELKVHHILCFCCVPSGSKPSIARWVIFYGSNICNLLWSMKLIVMCVLYNTGGGRFMLTQVIYKFFVHLCFIFSYFIKNTNMSPLNVLIRISYNDRPF